MTSSPQRLGSEWRQTLTGVTVNGFTQRFLLRAAEAGYRLTD